jgi:hypothetical protein
MKMPSIPLQSIPPVTITHSFYQVKSYAGNLGNEYADALAKNQSQSTLTLRMPPSKHLASREIPSITSTKIIRRK